jgi:hypothetical protein
MRVELLCPLATAQAKVRRQIERGAQLLSSPVSSETALNHVEAAKDRWTDFNIELMNQLLSGPEYADGYQKFHSSLTNANWGLEEKVDLFRAVVAEQLNQLKSDLERLELIPEAAGDKATLPMQTPPALPPRITNVFHGSVANLAQQSKDFHQISTNREKPKTGLSTEAKIAFTLIVTAVGAIAAWMAVPGFLKIRSAGLTCTTKWAGKFVMPALKEGF